MKQLYFLTALLSIFLTSACSSGLPGTSARAQKRYVYSSEEVHILLEVNDDIFKLLIKRPGTYCYNEGLYKVRDEKLQLRTLQPKGDPKFEQRYRENLCELNTESIAILSPENLKFQDYVLCRVN